MSKLLTIIYFLYLWYFGWRKLPKWQQPDEEYRKKKISKFYKYFSTKKGER